MKKYYYDLCKFTPSEDDWIKFEDEGKELDTTELFNEFNEISELVNEDFDEITVKVPLNFYEDLLCYGIILDDDGYGKLNCGDFEDGFWNYISNLDEITEEIKNNYDYDSEFDGAFKSIDVELKIGHERKYDTCIDTLIDELYNLLILNSCGKNDFLLKYGIMKQCEV